MNMNTVIIEVSSLEESAARAIRAMETGESQGRYRSFETPELLFKRLTPKRLEILHKMQGAGEMSLRELARRVERDVKGVHTDIHALLEFGLVEKTASGKIICPFDEIRFDFAMRAAA